MEPHSVPFNAFIRSTMPLGGRRAKEYGEEVLLSNMFADREGGSELVKDIVTKLSDLSTNKEHNRHIHYQDAMRMGLNIELLEQDPDLQDLVLTVHHCYMHTLNNTPAFKIIENHKERAFMKIERLQNMHVPTAYAAMPSPLE